MHQSYTHSYHYSNNAKINVIQDVNGEDMPFVDSKLEKLCISTKTEVLRESDDTANEMLLISLQKQEQKWNLMMKVLLFTNKDDVTIDFVVQELKRQRIDFYRFNTEELSKSVEIILDFDNEIFLLIDKLEKRSILYWTLQISTIEGLSYLHMMILIYQKAKNHSLK